jgi:hypothetical protein
MLSFVGQFVMHSWPLISTDCIFKWKSPVQILLMIIWTSFLSPGIFFTSVVTLPFAVLTGHGNDNDHEHGLDLASLHLHLVPLFECFSVSIAT